MMIRYAIADSTRELSASEAFLLGTANVLLHAGYVSVHAVCTCNGVVSGVSGLFVAAQAGSW